MIAAGRVFGRGPFVLAHHISAFPMKSVRNLLLAFAGLSILVHAAPAAEPSAALLPVSDFAKRPKYASIDFSPDGKQFAALTDLDGRMNLAVGNLEKGTLTRITSFKTYDVGRYRWISNSRLVISLYDASKGLAEWRGGGLFALNADGSESKELAPTQEACKARNQICRQTWFVARIPGSEDEIIAGANERDLRSDDLYRLNTKTGRKTLLTDQNPGAISRWVIDQNNVPRAAISEDGRKLAQTFWYRESATAPWRKIMTATGLSAPRIKPAGFDSDGLLLVYSNLDSDKFKLYEFDVASGKPGKLVLEHPLVDLDTSDLRIRTKDHRIVGVQIDADKPEVAWFDETYAKLQKLMDASLPAGNINEIVLLDDGKLAVYSHGDRDPGEYYLYDPALKRLERVLRPRDWIKPERMASTQVVRYKARDGLEIPGYLTLPTGKPATRLPLIAWIHGGPWARDDWGFNPDVQFLANRGYAVFQPNFRSSTGFGVKHYTAGFKQYGLAMQDDITDGVRYLIAQGIVDKDRVCIGGGSYGGYATMMGLVKEPDMFKCGINEAGVVDLIWGQELGYTDFNQSDPDAAEAFYTVAMGDVKADRAMLEKYSPRLHADQIKAPVLIVHAVHDRRVPFQHAEGMRDALKAAGKPYEWLVFPDEGHGFTKMENRIKRYEAIEAFLRKNLGP